MTWHRGLGELKQIKRGLAMNNTFLTFIPPSLGAKYEFWYIEIGLLPDSWIS